MTKESYVLLRTWVKLDIRCCSQVRLAGRVQDTTDRKWEGNTGLDVNLAEVNLHLINWMSIAKSNAILIPKVSRKLHSYRWSAVGDCSGAGKN